MSFVGVDIRAESVVHKNKTETIALSHKNLKKKSAKITLTANLNPYHIKEMKGSIIICAVGQNIFKKECTSL